MPVVGVGGLPSVREHRSECLDLVAEVVRGGARKANLLPVEARCAFRVGRHQPRRIDIAQIREDEHGRRMFEEPLRHLVEAEPDVLEADLLRDSEQWDVREVW